MSDAPKAIWASVDGTNSEGGFGFWDLRKVHADNPDYTPYIRADIADAEKAAAVRAAREALAATIEAEIGTHIHPKTSIAEVLRNLAAAIRASDA